MDQLQSIRLYASHNILDVTDGRLVSAKLYNYVSASEQINLQNCVSHHYKQDKIIQQELFPIVEILNWCVIIYVVSPILIGHIFLWKLSDI